jgi:hypothetical protein
MTRRLTKASGAYLLELRLPDVLRLRAQRLDGWHRLQAVPPRLERRLLLGQNHLSLPARRVPRLLVLVNYLQEEGVQVLMSAIFIAH